MIKKSIEQFNLIFLLIILVVFLCNIKIAKSQEDDEEEDKKDYYVHFNLSDPDIIIVDKNSDNPEIKDIISKTASITLPKVELDKEGYFFSGWTEDGIYGFLPGGVFLCHKKNITLNPVMGELSDGRFFRLEYIVEFEGEIIDTGGNLPKGNYVKNRIVETSMLSFPQTKAIQKGWTDGKNTFYQAQKLVMPERNVTLRAVFHYYRTLTYDAGDVEGIVGVKQNIQTGYLGAQMDLAEAERIKRNGYNNVAWHCENDGMDYPPFYMYIMPDEDVVMTAVWEPINYNIVFTSGVKSIPNIKIRGLTGSKIIAPYLEQKREGYIFIGWKIYENEIYYPGDEIPVIGQIPGFGITAEAIWIIN